MCQIQQKIVFSQVGNDIAQMKRRISFRPYSREFVRPLATATGEWAMREGFILRIEKGDRIGYGEIAPIPEFGTETVDEARRFLDYLINNPESLVPRDLPCCAFGLSAALSPRAPLPMSRDRIVAALLPAGSHALKKARGRLEAGFSNFKWKIGVGPVEEELELCSHLLGVLGPSAKLRLDANGGLSLRELELWLECLLPYGKQIDFLEQPLPVGQEHSMAEVAEASGISIALDESLNGPASKRWFESGAWDGPLVIKSLLMGDLNDLAERLKPCAERLVFSSVFETAVGLGNVLCLMDMLPDSSYAVGFDTVSVFRDGLSLDEMGPIIYGAQRFAFDMEDLWNRLPHLN